MRKIIKEKLVNLLFRLIGGNSYQKLNTPEVEELMDGIIGKSEYQSFITFLNQSADEAKNKYMYSDDKIYKGMALAFVMLKESLIYRKKRADKKEVEDNQKEQMEKDGKNPNIKRKVNY